MKIVFLSDYFPPQSFGGAGISTYELALGMKKAGQEVFVITTCRKESEAGESDYNGLKIYKIASDYSGRWRSYVSLYNRLVVREVEKLLKTIKPDVVHANNIHLHLSYHSLKLAQKYARVVLTFRDTMAFTYGKLKTKKYLDHLDSRITWVDNLKQAKKRWNPFRNFVIKRYLRYADKLLSVSEALRRALEQNGIKNVEVVHTGMDLSKYSASYDQVNKKIVFFSGRLSDAKGAKVVREVMQMISKKMPEVELVTAGTEGKWLNREEMKAAYAASNVVLAPSLYLDPFPRVVLEAMAMGKPVVGTCYGGAPEAILDNVTGYIVNPFNVEEMAEKIIDLLKNPDRAEKFGKAGHERIKTAFNLDEKVKSVLACYHDEFGIK